MSSPISASGRTRDVPQVAFNLAFLALAAALGALVLAYAIDAARDARRGSERFDDGTRLTRAIGGHDLEIPAAWFRHAEQQVDGFSEQVDLRLMLPLGPQGQLSPVEVTLLPRSRARPSSRLLDAVYLHQFTAAELSGPPGLVGKPLRETAGFVGETVWYDALSPDPFVAKCSAPIAAGAQSRCLRTVHQEDTGVAVVYAFGADALANWRAFDAEMLPRLRQIGL